MKMNKIDVGVNNVGFRAKPIEIVKNDAVQKAVTDVVKKASDIPLQTRQAMAGVRRSEDAVASKPVLTLSEVRKVKIAEVKNELGEETIKNCDAKKILPYFGIDVKENENGLLTISEYRQPSHIFTFQHLGIDENKLLENVEHIDGNVDLTYSNAVSLGQLQSIGGNASFTSCKVKNLGQLKSVGGFLGFDRESHVQSLGPLQSIGGPADFHESPVTDLGQLRSIGGGVILVGSKLKPEDFKNVEVKGKIYEKTFGY